MPLQISSQFLKFKHSVIHQKVVKNAKQKSSSINLISCAPEIRILCYDSVYCNVDRIQTMTVEEVSHTNRLFFLYLQASEYIDKLVQS